ncbi:hypothetical protein Salat_2655000 [Sesamum alatum]|uniref:Uncharacterized protein n=1 Tax=Sesamum alatum TaxID=300844 RepID=A0AAE2CAZ9_9LAMI|nr:hypothetical protein Salat_2655000 [Sesamum alatum]
MVQKVASVDWNNETDERFLHGDHISFWKFLSSLSFQEFPLLILNKIWKRDANLRADMTLAGLMVSESSVLTKVFCSLGMAEKMEKFLWDHFAWFHTEIYECYGWWWYSTN